MGDDVINVQHEQVGATEGDYEYDYGSYGDLLDKQLAAIRTKAELKAEEAKADSLLGTRNMAVLNTALAGRDFLEKSRERYIMGKIKDEGGVGKQAEFISDEEYQALPEEDRVGLKQSEDGQWFSGNWDYDKSKGFWSDVGRSITGWQAGVHAVAEKNLTMDDQDEITNTVVENVDIANPLVEKINEPEEIVEPVVEDEQDAQIPFIDKKKNKPFSPATTSDDDIDTDPDIKPDDSWNNVDIKKDDAKKTKKSIFSWLTGPSMYSKDAEPRWNAPGKKSKKTVDKAVNAIEEKEKALKQAEILKSEGKMELANRQEHLDKTLTSITDPKKNAPGPIYKTKR